MPRDVGAVLRRTCAAIAVSTVGFSAPAYASGVPVIDAAAIAQAVLNLQETVKLFEEAEKRLKELERQVEQFDEIIDDLTGTRNMSDLLNGGSEGTQRRYAETDLSGFIALATGGGGLSGNASGLEAAGTAIVGDYGFRSGSTMVPSDPTGPRARSIDLAQGTTLAAMTVGEAAFNGSAARMATVEGLIGAIDGTDDLKESIDLQTRMQGQIALLLSEMIMLQGLQLRTSGVEMGVTAVGEEMMAATFEFDRAEYDALNAPASP